MFKRELRILLNQIDHVALLAALRREDVNAPATAFTERALQQFAIGKVDGQMNLARQKRRRTRIRTVKVDAGRGRRILRVILHGRDARATRAAVILR